MNKQSRTQYNSFDEFWSDFMKTMKLAHDKKKIRARR